MQYSSPEPETLGAAKPAAAPLEDALMKLDPAWIVLADLRIGAPPDDISADYVLLHRDRGVALIELAPGKGKDAVEAFRAFLEGEGFSAFFPGTLAIVQLVIPADEGALEARLDAAFAAAPPSTIAEPDWVGALNALLVAPEPTGAAPEARSDEWNAASPPAQPAFQATTPAAADAASFDRPEPLRVPLEDRRLQSRSRRRWPAVLLLACAAGGGIAWWVMAPPTGLDALDRSAASNTVAIPLQESANSAAPGASQSTPPKASSDAGAPSAAIASREPAADAAASADSAAIPPVPPAPPPRAIATPSPPASPSAAIIAAPKSAPQPPPPAKPAPPSSPALATSTRSGAPTEASKPGSEASRTPMAEANAETAAGPPSSPPPLAAAARPEPSPPSHAASVAKAEPPAPAPAPPRAADRAPAPHEAPDAVQPRAEPTAPAATIADKKAAPPTAPKPALAREAAPPPRATPPEMTATASRPSRDHGAARRSRAPAPQMQAEAERPDGSHPRSGPPLDAADLPPLATMGASQPPEEPKPAEPIIAHARPLPLVPAPAPIGAPSAEARAAAAPPGPQMSALPVPVSRGPAERESSVCRIYNASMTVLGQQRPVKGLACRRADGTWQVVTQAPASRQQSRRPSAAGRA